MIYLLAYLPLRIVIFWVLFWLIEIKQWGGKPLMLIGLIWDVSFNLLEASILFWKLPQLIAKPRQITFSQRLQAYQQLDDWRGKLAKLICRIFLEPFAPNHCKQG